MTSINATINIKHDTLESAFIKKSNNSSLSLKSLNKLASIANTTFGLSKADAKKLFLNGQCIGKSEVSTRLAKQLTDVIAKVSNDDLKKHISNFIHNCGYIDERNIPKKKACAPQKETHPTQLRINTLYAERLYLAFLLSSSLTVGAVTSKKRHLHRMSVQDRKYRFFIPQHSILN